MRLPTALEKAILFFGAFFLMGFGCSKEPGYKKKIYVKRQMISNSGDVKLPIKLWDRLEKVGVDDALRPFGGGAAPAAPAHEAKGGGHEAAKAEHESAANAPRASDDKSVDFFDFKVLISEKTEGVLGGENYELQYAKGGGELDLNSFVKKPKGSFYLVVESESLSKESAFQVFYLSNSIKRTIRDENVGSGCNQYYEITSYFKKQMTDQGFLVNSTDLRHISALAGTYFFATRKDGHLNLSQLTISDSNHAELLCR